MLKRFVSPGTANVKPGKVTSLLPVKGLSKPNDSEDLCTANIGSEFELRVRYDKTGKMLLDLLRGIEVVFRSSCKELFANPDVSSAGAEVCNSLGRWAVSQAP